MKRVLITGANSFVGTNIELWLDKSFDGPNKLFKVEIVSLFAKEHGHKIWISRLFNLLYGWGHSSCLISLRCLPTRIMCRK